MTDIQPAPTARRSRAGGGADARRLARNKPALVQAGYIRRNIKLYEPFSDDQLELIENNTETILQEIGIEFRDDAEACAMWKAAGAAGSLGPRSWHSRHHIVARVLRIVARVPRIASEAGPRRHLAPGRADRLPAR